MHLLTRFQEAILSQRGAMFGWVPVCLAIGIGWYFMWPTEPAGPFWMWLAVAGALLLVGSRFVSLVLQPFMMALVLVMAGAGLAKWQMMHVDAPILGFRYYGPIEGRVVAVDRSASDAVRLTLDNVRLERFSPDRMPARVRVSVHGDQPLAAYWPGDHLMTTGHLSPPSGPAEPGGFDFQRHAYFAGLGAVGYTRSPILRAAPPQKTGFSLWLFTQRMTLSAAVQATMPADTGGVAAAIMMGDRSGIPQDSMVALRASNLAHLLAISGLHMGLLTGFVFAVLRTFMAAFPWISLHYPTKKIAAVAAMLTGAGYLALSGGNVATERAFIMVSVMFCAVLLDRRALSLRAVAMAAAVVLMLHPEALLGPGFQMSFAATTALVAVFAAMRKFDLSHWPKWLRGVMSLVISSGVAGLATAPIAAAHFNQIAHYGLIANLLSVPLMGLLVMPAAVLAVCLFPFGLSWIGLWVMDLGLRWILFVAHTVAGQDGALGHVPSPDMRIVALLAFGGLWLILWQGRARFAGVAVAVAAFGLWVQVERPALLVADSGALVGLMGPEGRDLSKARGAGFVAGIWLENDGGPVPQDVAFAREKLVTQGRVTDAWIGDYLVRQVNGKTALAALDGCGGADILISNQVDKVARPCLFFDVARLRSTGSLAIDLDDAGRLVVTPARAISGTRPWNGASGEAGTKIITLDPLKVAQSQ